MITSYPEALEAARATADRRVLLERDGARAVVRMHDAEKLNALSLTLTVQLHDVLRELAADQDVRCIVLTGTEPGFSAGGDLSLMQDVLHPMVDEGAGGATSTWRWITGQFGAIARLITGTDKAVIAAVNGAAAGVGLAFALSCDLIIASERARFVPAFGRIALVPESGLSWLLTRRLGYQRAFELFVEGRHLSGAEAVDVGLANAVVPHEALIATALEWCDRIERLPAHVPALTKRMLRSAADMTWDQAIVVEELAMPMCFTTAAHRRAVSDWFDR
jgi:2-(1,2-epoxy-1,2-dihydrophenyl)acetyl-CoA isomerase